MCAHTHVSVHTGVVLHSWAPAAGGGESRNAGSPRAPAGQRHLWAGKSSQLTTGWQPQPTPRGKGRSAHTPNQPAPISLGPDSSTGRACWKGSHQPHNCLDSLKQNTSKSLVWQLTSHIAAQGHLSEQHRTFSSSRGAPLGNLLETRVP